MSRLNRPKQKSLDTDDLICYIQRLESYCDTLEENTKFYKNRIEELEKNYLYQCDSKKELLRKLDKYKKAFDKACDILSFSSYMCPKTRFFYQEEDCRLCDKKCEEYWKEYFMKEVEQDD